MTFRRHDQRGLTLIETMAALLIFAMMTLGLVPVLISSVRGASLSRSGTVAKNLAVEALERVRGLPYFISYGTQPSKVDLLDLIYPSASGIGYSGGRYTTICTQSSTDPACTIDLPDGYTLSYEASFVVAGDADANGNETYEVEEPNSDYAWNVQSKDVPASQLLRVAAIISWQQSGRLEQYRLTSLIGERQLAALRLRGTARVDYAVQVQANYAVEDSFGGPPDLSDLVAVAGTAESKIETRQLSQASQSTTGGFLRLTRPATETDAAVILASGTGANTNYQAPGDQDPAPDGAGAAVTINHPDLGQNIAYLNSTTTIEQKVKIANELPNAEGRFNATAGPVDLWVTNQADFSSGSLLGLDSSKPIFSVEPQGSAAFTGKTIALTGPVTGTRVVQTMATAFIKELKIFPVNYISASQPRRVVLSIQDFTATVDCQAKPGTGGFATSYSGTVTFWTDPDGSDSGSFETLSLSGTQTADPFDALAARNPMVKEDTTSVLPEGSPIDVYLFPVVHNHDVAGVNVRHDHVGYFESLESLFSVGTSGSVESGGQVVRAGLTGAIRIVTEPTDPDIAESGLAISLGKLSCEAVDLR